MPRRNSKTTNLRAQLAKALKTDRLDQALSLYERIEKKEPDEPRWSHRKGDLLQRMDRKADAALAYERAVDGYAAKGFVARAAAMAKVILAIDPSKGEVLDRVDPEAARRLHRQNRSVIVTADAPPSPDSNGPTTETHSLITDALPLITDQTAPPGETRFTKPEKTADVKLDLTDIELVERPVARESLMSLRPSAATLAQLPAMPLFAEVPRNILEALVRESTLVDVEDGQRLVTAGTTADALYVLVEGNAIGQRGTDLQSLLLGEGDVAGVSCLLSNVNYGEDVIACGRVRALRISKLLLDRLVEQHPPLDDVILEILSRRLVATLLRTNRIFTAFDERTRKNIAGLFEVRRALAGTKILEGGKRADAMYLPLHGRIVAKKPDGTRIGDMELGHALGQESILTRQPSPITVEAKSDVLVLRMSAARFAELLLRRPDVVQHIQILKRRHSRQTYSLRTDQTDRH
ncbi:MAG: cyclic nucleotide-binding domain-containing protein [Myxococcales bacterium]|nr:cyclic nucleotide-binding domain-containing protein [Myxococcales bacterium]MDH3483034.1 cyclic nucleotide-binding domain-containing protein [Myxococcales bacterium]